MLLAFDTETSGKYDFKSPPTAPHQPRLMQLGLQVLDKELNPVASWSTLIEATGFDPEPGAVEVHGISGDKARAYGIPVQHALAILKKYRSKCEYHMCHNEKFDRGIINAEMARLGQPFFLESNGFCTMQALTPVLKIPGPYGNKWPRLEEAFERATGTKMQIWMEGKGLSAHDAMGDVTAMVEVFRWMRKEHPLAVWEGLR